MKLKGIKVPVGIWFLHFFVRPIWSGLFNLFIFIPKHLWLFAFSPIDRNKYLSNKKVWNEIKDIDELVKFFKNNVKYVWDGPKGGLDHDNTNLEFFMRGFDCDDAGRLPYKLIKRKKMVSEVYWIGIIGPKLYSWHYDCLFNWNDKWYLLNQGNLLIGDTVIDVIDQLSAKKFSPGGYIFPKGLTNIFNARCLFQI